MTKIEIIGYLLSSLLSGFLIGYFFWRYVFTKEAAVVHINADDIIGNGEEPLLEMKGRGTLIVKSNTLELRTSNYIKMCVKEYENRIQSDGTILKN